MYSLLLKDILVQKKTIIFAVFYSIFAHFAFGSPVFSGLTYIMAAVAITYMYIIGACAYDDKNKSEVILNSLPLKRRDIVLSKYLSMLVFMGISLLTVGVVGALMKSIGLTLPHGYIKFRDILGVFVSIAFLSSLFFPVYFKFGYPKTRFFNLILFLLVFFAPGFLTDLLKNSFDKPKADHLANWLTGLNSQPDWFVMLLVSTGMILILLISYLLSLKFYGTREF